MTRKYDKTGLFSKKIKQYLSKGELDNILLSIKKFEEWINKSSKGNKIKAHAWHLYMAGLIELVQKKHGDFDYEYIAIRK